MYIFVRVMDLDPNEKDGSDAGRIESRLELASGDPFLIVPHRRLNSSRA